MIPRMIHALYKRGSDELKISFRNSEEFAQIQNSLGKEAMGFELLESGKTYCIVKNVVQEGKEFSQIMRQTFLMLLSMAEDGYLDIKNKKFSELEGLIPLEKSNNRFTTIMRRQLNAQGSEDFDRIGPIYYIVEQLEKIADEYKHFYNMMKSNRNEIRKEMLALLNESNKNLRRFYSLFYKFDPSLVSELKNSRDEIYKELYSQLGKIKKPEEILLFSFLMGINSMIFSLVDPFLILAMKQYSAAMYE